MSAANVVTLARVGIALTTLGLLWLPTDQIRFVCAGLTLFVIYMDALDGFLARKLNQVSKLGGILDIAGDRAVEMAYWIVFAVLDWIPVWVPLLFLVRGTFVDAIRTQAMEKGLTAFGANTMMQTSVGKFLVSSNFSRFSYAVAKAAAFCLVIAANTSIGSATMLPSVALAFVYLSCFFCIVRGLPVLLEANYLFK